MLILAVCTEGENTEPNYLAAVRNYQRKNSESWQACLAIKWW